MFELGLLLPLRHSGNTIKLRLGPCQAWPGRQLVTSPQQGRYCSSQRLENWELGPASGLARILCALESGLSSQCTQS